MAKSLNIETYPHEYRELFRAVDAGRTLILKKPTKAECQKLQFDLLGFKRALTQVDKNGRAIHEKDSCFMAAMRFKTSIKISLDGGYELHMFSLFEDPLGKEVAGLLASIQEDDENTIQEEQPIQETPSAYVPVVPASGPTQDEIFSKMYPSQHNVNGEPLQDNVHGELSAGLGRAEQDHNSHIQARKEGESIQDWKMRLLHEEMLENAKKAEEAQENLAKRT